jgi:hypothetical protein
MIVINSGTGGKNWLFNLIGQLICKVVSHLATIRVAMLMVKKLPGLNYVCV